MTTSLSPHHRRLIEDELRLADRARQEIGAHRAAPYDAHLRLRSRPGNVTDLLLGAQTCTRAGLALVDWRRAPLAEVFFGFDVGEEYEIDIPDRALTGVVVERNLVAFERGVLVEIASPDATLSRRGTREWRAVPTVRAVPSLDSRPGDGPRPSSPANVELDAAQRAAVDLPRDRPVLVLGEAGAGKTIVALRRVARVLAAARRPLRTLVVVPTEGLRALAASILERLGVTTADVVVYDRFAAHEARRSFPDLPHRESRNASAAVVRLKRHPALRQALAIVARRPAACAEPDAPRRRSRALVRRDDLHELFGDRILLEEVVAHAGGTLPRHAIEAVREHARIQFSQTADEEFAHVMAEARRTSDGRPIDEGTPMEDADTVDVEDYAILFEMDRLRALDRTRRPTAPRKYDVVAVDEAQELAPLELALIGRCVARGGTLVVCGDAAQQVDPTTAFPGWDAAMAELGARGAETHVLGTSYRCPAEVNAWARRLRAPAGAPIGDGFPVARFEAELHLVSWLVDALRAHVGSDPSASVAVICRTADAAAQLARVLGYGLTVHLVLEGRFTFRPGIVVTCVDEVKGLEFDDVVVPDASAVVYPDTDAARRALYVAVTRALRQVVLAASGEPSPLAVSRAGGDACPDAPVTRR